jgi:hypothetical protein
MSMNSADVLDGFFLCSLPLEKAEKGECLVLLHDATSQRPRCKGNLGRHSTLKWRTGEGGSKVNIQN